MIEALQFTFMQHALVAAVIVSLIAGIVGSLVVINRMVFLTGGIAHASYGGIGLALYFSFPIVLGASLFAVATSLLLAYLTLHHRRKLDTHIGLIWAVGMAIGIVFTDMTQGYHVDLLGYLFGSILAVDRQDLIIAGILLAVIASIVTLRYRQLLAVSYDSEFAMLSGIDTPRCYTLLLLMASLSVVAAIKVVGLILVIALFTVPVHIAEKVTTTLWQMMAVASLLALLFSIAGLYLAYRFDLTSGATIILVAAAGMLLSALLPSKR